MKLGNDVVISVDGKAVNGDLTLKKGSPGLVLFAYGSGSSRFSPRQRFVAERLNGAGFSTLFMDLLTPEEEVLDEVTREYRFDIPLLAGRLESAMRWAKQEERTKDLPLGLTGGSTGAAACLIAAARRASMVKAVVSRGGRTDLADWYLPDVTAATLFIVGGEDEEVLELNRDSYKKLKCGFKELEIVPGATHLFEEPGKMDKVAELTVDWFRKYLV
ncbi:MAG TPA: dienelactone hydrolase family protein [bacterium]|nr:dienelactone hydrolase family protein [bacterium]